MKQLLIILFIIVNSVYIFAASELTFNSSAELTSLILGDDDDLLGPDDDGEIGFFLENSVDETFTKLTNLTQSGDMITVSNSDGSITFTLEIKSYDNHVALHLLNVTGVGTGEDYNLSLNFICKDKIGITAYTLNDMMTHYSRRYIVNLMWNNLWGRARSDDQSKGSVVLYKSGLTGSTLDNVLAEIWSEQAAANHMVKPLVDSWTKADVLSWVDAWVEKFKRLSVISIDGETTPERLYEMTNKYAIPTGANRVYMFSSSWREAGMYTVKKTVFPNGKSDLIAYSDYLASHGIQLHLRSLSPQITDEKYFSDTFVDDRIMGWSSGTLEDAIDEDDETISFRGTLNIGSEMATDGYVRIGNEVLYATSITNTDSDVWLLSGCSRGEKGSSAQAHSAGADMEGLLISNRIFNFDEDFGLDNSLGEEICGGYGDFLNDVNVTHLHFDGTSAMAQPPWYVREFTDYVYSRVDHPTTGSIVGGDGLPAHFEIKFSKALEISGMWNYWLVRIGVRLHEYGRKHLETATSKMELNFDISDGIMRGSRRLMLCGGWSGSLLSLSMLEQYGLTDYSLELFKSWNEVLPVFSDADAEYVSGFMTKRITHYTGPDALTLSKNSEGKYIFTPHRVMLRTSGADSAFVIDQEWGAIAVWQNVNAGGTVELDNPYAEQPLRAMIWVDSSSAALQDPLLTVNGTGTLSVDGDIQQMEFMEYVGGDTVAVYDSNWVFQHSLPATATNFIANNGTVSVTTAAGTGSTAPVLKVQYITLGPTYVLEANDFLEDSTVVDPSGIAVAGVTVSPSEKVVTLGDFANLTTLTATFTPSDAADQSVVWTSSNTAVAMVNEDGLVIPVGVGYAIITATSVDGSYSDECVINVLAAPENIALNGIATQSTTLQTAVASLAMDGNSEGSFNSGSVTHTNTNDGNNHWWQVDLGSDYKIGDILIYGRTDNCCADRLTDYTLYIFNSAGDTTYTENFTTFPITATNAGGVDGQIIKIEINSPFGLSLAEVKVYNEQDTTTAIDTQQYSNMGSEKLKVYPNPVEDRFTIEVAEEAKSYIVINRAGQTLLSGDISEKTAIVDASLLPSGVYQVQVGTMKQLIYKAEKECDCP